MAASPTGAICCIAVVMLGALIGAAFYCFIFDTATYVTVTLLGARGLDTDEKTTRTSAVEFDVAIGFFHLGKDSAVAHDGSDVTISYSGVKLAEGPVPEFYVAGGPRLVEATRAVATTAGKDQAPLSLKFRDYLQVSQQLDGKLEFEVLLSFFDAHDIITGDTKRSHYHCTADLALPGKAAVATICGEAAFISS